MASGDIILNMIGRNNVSPAATAASASLTALNAKIDAHISRLVGETRAQAAFNSMIAETSKEQARNVQVSGRNQMAIQQLIFAVDDASTVYGTTGFAGAIRAASNNLTVAAAALGPWGAAIAVGVSAVTQLTMAFMKNKEEVKDNSSVMDEFRKQIEAVEKVSSRIGKGGLPFTPGAVTSEQYNRMYGELESKKNTASQNYLNRDALVKRLEEERKQFAISHTTDPRETIGGLSEEDRRTYDEMGREIERVKEEAFDFWNEMHNAARALGALRKELEGIQEREAAQFGAQQDQSDLAREQREFQQREQEKAAIDEEAMRRFDAMKRSGTLGISARGPSTLRSGEADTFRFLNQARLGAAAKSAEAKELEKLNRNSAEILATLREQVRLEKEAEKEPEVIDF